jgi:hypothetical protein
MRELPPDNRSPEITFEGMLWNLRRSRALPHKPLLFPESFSFWSWRRDLNPRPSDYKSDALPTELRQQVEARPLRHNTP